MRGSVLSALRWYIFIGLQKLSYGKARIRDFKKSQKKVNWKCQSQKKVKVKSQKKGLKKVNHRPQLEKVKKKSKKGQKKVEKSFKKKSNCGSSPWRITGVKKSQK